MKTKTKTRSAMARYILQPRLVKSLKSLSGRASIGERLATRQGRLLASSLHGPHLFTLEMLLYFAVNYILDYLSGMDFVPHRSYQLLPFEVRAPQGVELSSSELGTKFLARYTQSQLNAY